MHQIPLLHNRPLRLAGALRIECVAGTVWLTRTAAAGDFFLRTGDSCVIAAGDSALVEALGQAHIRLHRVPAPWQRLLARGAAVLSSLHERMRTVRCSGRRTPLAG
jgi:hypothetical protein